METDAWNLELTPPLANQFNRLKTQYHFENDHDLLQAAFNALDGERHQAALTERFMKHPGLSPDDYEM